MAEPLPSSASLSFEIDGVQAVVEWVEVDSQLRYLHQGASDPSRQVTFELRFDAASRAAFFKIRVPVGLKGAGNAKMPLYIYIHPDRITSLDYDVPDVPPDVVKRKLGRTPSRLQFTLTRPADMVVPLISLAPQNKGHGDMLDSMKLLTQETCFSVYFTHASLSKAAVRPLCDAIATQSLKSIDAAADLRGLYGGAGGKMLEGAELYRFAPNMSPPSYDELAPSPPRASVKAGSSKSTGSSRKRRRGSASSATGRPDSYITATCKKMIDEMMSQHRQEERAYFTNQLEQLKTSFNEDLRQLKSEMLEHVHQRLSDIEVGMCSIDDVDEHISQHVSSFEDLIEVKIEDHVTGIKAELEDFVDNEVANAEDRVIRRVRDASWTVAIDE